MCGGTACEHTLCVLHHSCLGSTVLLYNRGGSSVSGSAMVMVCVECKPLAFNAKKGDDT